MSNLFFPVNGESLIIPHISFKLQLESEFCMTHQNEKEYWRGGKIIFFHPCKIKHEEPYLRIFYDQGMAN